MGWDRRTCSRSSLCITQPLVCEHTRWLHSSRGHRTRRAPVNCTPRAVGAPVPDSPQIGSSSIDPTALPTGDGCVDCLADGGWWLHLRRCAACGHIGCCESSPQQHASSHARTEAHPIIQSYEPGETWFWDYADGEYLDGPPLAPPHHHPTSQPTPGPAGRVPANWRDLLN